MFCLSNLQPAEILQESFLAPMSAPHPFKKVLNF